jgi:hypothetical protein
MDMPLCWLDAGGLLGVANALRLTESNLVFSLTDGKQRLRIRVHGDSILS